jgi:hypothetical protein
VQVLKDVEPFELWYRERLDLQNSIKTRDFVKDDHIQPKVEANNAKNKPMNNFKISDITTTMINQVEESIRKFNENDNEQISRITKSMIDKTQESLTKFEEIDTLRYNLALKQQNRIMRISQELAKNTIT